MNFDEVGILSLEASGSLLIWVICYKILKMKIKTHSGCCGDKFEIDTENEGAKSTPMDSVLSQV
tara:strand:- start:1067 stop:1258 length:192 start_codon:yes stop_codon:yes gene_type:complete